MRFAPYISLLVIFLGFSVRASDFHDKIRNFSVSVFAKGANGSGVIIRNKNKVFCLTAGHVIANSRKTTTIINPATGQAQLYYTNEWEDVIVTQYTHVHNLKLNYITSKAHILKFSPYEVNDLALMEIIETDKFSDGAKFAKDNLNIGDDAYHVGAPHNNGNPQAPVNAQSCTYGTIIEKPNEMWHTFDGIHATGSSGGPVFSENGEYNGMITRTQGLTRASMIPVNTIKAWLKQEGYSHLYKD